MNIEFGINNKRKKVCKDVLIGRYAEELYLELENKELIKRLDSISQLGSIRVPAKKKKTRLDYVNLQLYIHDVLRKNKSIKYIASYNSPVRNNISCEEKMFFIEKGKKISPTVLDVIQIMIFVSNIGHFKNTFSANIAILETCYENKEFKDELVNCFNEEDRELILSLIDNNDYKRLNLGMALLILDKCDKNKISVQLAKELIKTYYYEVIDNSKEKDNLGSAFEMYRNVRNLAFYAYDLPVSTIPLNVDITSEDDICSIFKEIQNKYNNNRPAKQLFNSIGKLLGDTVYNKDSEVIANYQGVVKSIKKELLKKDKSEMSIIKMLMSEEGILNKKYEKKQKFDTNNILKVTFEKDEVDFEELFYKISKMNYVRAGYYHRQFGKRTILIALDKKANAKVALKVMGILLGKLKNDHDKIKKEMNIVKFFLYVLFNCGRDNKTVEINPTKGVELYVAKGAKKRVKFIEKYIYGDKKDDFEHELCLVRDYLKENKSGETTVVIAGSIRIVDYKNKGHDKNEYDGMLIFPYRKNKEVIFFEAKNKKKQKNEGKKCLVKKLDNIKLSYNKDDIIVIGHDCYYEHTLNNQ